MAQHKVLAKELKYRWPQLGDKIMIKNYTANNDDACFLVIKEKDSLNTVTLLDITYRGSYSQDPYMHLYWGSPGSIQFNNGNYYENYIDSGFDTASISYYNALNTKVKAVAVQQNVVQGAYNFSTSSTKTLDPSATFAMTYWNVFGGLYAQQYTNYYRIAGKFHSSEERYVTLASTLDLLPVLQKDTDGFYTGESIIDKVITTIDPSDLSEHLNKYRLQTIDVCPSNSGSGLTRPTFGIQYSDDGNHEDSRFYELNRANTSDALFKIKLDLRKLD